MVLENGVDDGYFGFVVSVRKKATSSGRYVLANETTERDKQTNKTNPTTEYLKSKIRKYGRKLLTEKELMGRPAKATTSTP